MYHEMTDEKIDQKIAEYKKRIHEMELELSGYLAEKQRRREAEKDDATRKYIGRTFKAKYRILGLRYEDIIHITDVKETEAYFMRVSPYDKTIERGKEILFCAEPIGIAQDQSEANWMINTFFEEVPRKAFDRQMKKIERSMR